MKESVVVPIAMIEGMEQLILWDFISKESRMPLVPQAP